MSGSSADDERCAKAAAFLRLHDAFRQGDLVALRAAVDDPDLVPNGRMPDTIGSCLVYGGRGVPGVIPAGALLTAEITILDTKAPITGRRADEQGRLG